MPGLLPSGFEASFPVTGIPREAGPPMIITLENRSSSLVRAALIYLIDGTIAAVSLLAAASLRVGSVRAGEVLEEHGAALPLFVAVALVTFAALRLHRRVWRYSSTDEIFEIVQSIRKRE